jgi:release factor glutamine methyltransferase
VGPGEVITWRELLAEAGERLAASGIPESEISARRIVEECSGAEGAELPLVLGDRVTQRGVAAFDRRLERRLAGEPIQYVVGRWGFRTLDLFVDRRVLIPRPETEIVAGAAIDEVHRIGSSPGSTPVTAVDLGCGSGAIGLSIAAETAAVEVWLTDISEDALVVARGNLAGLGRLGARARIAAGSWFDALPVALKGSIGVVVSNPPYIAATEALDSAVADWEPSEALVSGPNGMEALQILVDRSPAWLIDDGALVLEMSPWQTGRVAELAAQSFGEVEIVEDLRGLARAVVARKPFGGSAGRQHS